MSERILIVDDEESLRMSLKFKLKSAGFEVELASDGEEALQKLKAKMYEVVLLDIKMPRMSGIDVLNHIRQDFPRTETIMLTAFADFSTAIECLKMGARDYLVKPVDATELITRLRSLMRSRTSERALQEVHERLSMVLPNDLVSPLRKIQSILDQALKLEEDSSSKERNRLLLSAREIMTKVEKSVQGLIDVTKRAAQHEPYGKK